MLHGKQGSGGGFSGPLPPHGLIPTLHPKATKTPSYTKWFSYQPGETESRALYSQEPVSPGAVIAEASVSLTVDDWRSATINGEMVVNLTSRAEDPGKYGGHLEWSGSGSRSFATGESCSMSAEGSNISMPHAQYNQFVFNCSMRVVATETIETRVNGSPVPGQSTRTVNYISCEGNTLRTEKYVLLADGTWAKISGATNTYDVQNRLTPTVQDNGRSMTQALNCEGNLMWRNDEDGIRTDYAYSPYGIAASSGNVTQPIQWSSEYADTDLGLVCYNYRHYNPLDGRWTGRDKENEMIVGYSLYNFLHQSPILNTDFLGLDMINSICNEVSRHLREDRERKECLAQCLNQRTQDIYAAQRFAEGASSANSSVGGPGAGAGAAQGIIALLLSIAAFARYEACANGCKKKYHNCEPRIPLCI